MSGFWMGHTLLGDVIGFCAAAHLYSEKMGRPVQVWFDPSRKDACKYFDGVVWVPQEEIPRAVDCGADPTPQEWPSMNGVKRFYRFMDPTMTPTKSFDIHFNRIRLDNTAQSGEKLIGLITHSNTQGDIDDQTLEEMLSEARKLYPEHKIILFGNKDNTKVPAGVEDRRPDEGDIDWIIDVVSRLDLLITPQSGPCFIASGWRIPMWVYRSRQDFWDWTLNYDTHQVQRWWDRNEPVVKPNVPLYINWKTGLGDAILHVSLYYHYARHIGQKLFFYGNSKLIDRKMREFVDIVRTEQPDIDQWIEQVPVETIRPVDGGPEDFTGWIPIPSDNCVREHWQDFDCRNFISCMVKVMKFENVDHSADELDFQHNYLRYGAGNSVTNRIAFHLIGVSSGSYADNYEIRKEEIIALVNRFRSQGYEIVFLQPHDAWMRATFPWATFRDYGNNMKALFDELSAVRAVFAVDSGVAHATLCCGTPLYLFKIRHSGGLGFCSGDAEFVDGNTQLEGGYPRKRIVPKTPARRQNPTHEDQKLCETSDGLFYREGTTDYDVINSVIIQNEYGLKPDDVSGKVVFDIGGNIGAFSVLCARMGARKITCFEPVFENHLVLHKNIEKYPSITAITAAIGRSDEHAVPFAKISRVGNNFGGAHAIYSSGETTVPLIKLDDVLDQVDLLKIDCEGSEFPILLTTTKLRNIKFITGEFHNFREGDTRYSLDILRGFSIAEYNIEHLTEYLSKQGMKTQFSYFNDGIGFFKAWWE